MNLETTIMQRIRLALGSTPGLRIFRNNVGRIEDRLGRWHVFGLCPGSSDLIGWRSIIVTPEMVGRPIAQFVAIEIKTPGAYTKKKHLNEQIDFIAAVYGSGGVAGIAESVEEARALLR